MRQKATLAIGSGVIIIIAAYLALSAFHDAGVMAQRTKAESKISGLASFIELYRHDFGKYPESLTILEHQEGDDVKNLIRNILQSDNQNNLTLEYQPQTNGFLIIIKGFDSWGPEQNVLQRSYTIREALK